MLGVKKVVPAESKTLPSTWRRAVLRFGTMVLLWLGLTGSDLHSWLVGLPIVVLVTWLCIRLRPASSWKWRLRAVIPFTWYFTRQSITGGWDVARHAFSRSLRLNPAIVEYPLSLPSYPAQLFFCAIVGLLPGSLVVEISEGVASVHLLDASPEARRSLADLEEHVADLFDLPIPEGGNR